MTEQAAEDRVSTAADNVAIKDLTADTGKVSFLEKVGYSLGDAGSNFYWKTFEFFIFFFYTDVFGISATVAGTMFLVTRITDAVADPIMGSIADRTKTRWGHFRPYLVWFAIPLAAAGVLTFHTPNLGTQGKIIYAYATYMFLMFMYTALNIPYSALMGVMTSNSKERTSLASFRFMGAFTVATFVQYCTRNLAQYFGLDATIRAQHSFLASPKEWVFWFFSKDFFTLPSNQQKGWQMTMVLYGVLAVIMFVLCFFSTRERVAPPVQQKSNITRDLQELTTSRSFAVVLGSLLLVLTAFVLKGSVSLYYFKYYVHREDLLGPFLVVNGLAFLASVFVTNLISKYFDKKTLYMLAIGVGGLIVGGFYFPKPDDIRMMFILQALSSFVLGANSPIVWAMFADTADDAEWRTGNRNTGLVFSSAIFGTKVGVAVGAWIAGLILSIGGYVANTQQSASSIRAIILSMSLIPAVVLVVAALVMKFYPLNDKLMVRIEKELKERKAAEA
jgi:GPH family glycoside/pentoside/hexuronide:cation symporter